MDRWRALAWKKPEDVGVGELGLTICLESSSEQVEAGLDRLRGAWGALALSQKLSGCHESRMLGMGAQGALDMRSLIREVAEHTLGERLKEGSWRRVGAMLDCGANPDEGSSGQSALAWCLKRVASAVEEAPWLDLAGMCLAASRMPEDQAWVAEEAKVGGALGRAIEREHAKRVAQALRGVSKPAPAGPRAPRL